MQNYFTTRYRRVHDKIKDARMSDLGNKFSKVRSLVKSTLKRLVADNRTTPKFQSLREIRILSLLDHFPQSLSKIFVVGTRIPEFSYNQHWRKSWLFKCWAVCLVVCLPVIYQLQATSSEKLGILPRRDSETPAEKSRAEEAGNISRGRE